MTIKITLFHANWCGHCQKFKPIWFSVKEKFKDDTKFKFEETEESELGGTLPKINGKEIRGFPTIRIVNGKTELEYEGNRDINSFQNFIKAL